MSENFRWGGPGCYPLVYPEWDEDAPDDTEPMRHALRTIAEHEEQDNHDYLHWYRTFVKLARAALGEDK
jgi:hypothetical protein